MVVGGIDRLIYHIVANAPGSFHDSNVYRQSLFKPFIESRFPHEICLGDKAYPISHCLIPPYPDAEANDDASKALFNFRHSGARMEMMEHIYGIWKRRFPIAQNLRNHLPNAIKIINATAVLHKISILWEEIGVDQLDG